ncbi:MAG: hypothetical protein HY511_09280 [Actinobacteria bacterium]|nr:hypothetical protein [Actinomycetota bacterium]
MEAFKVPGGTPVAGYGSVRRRLLFPDVLGLYPHAFWFKPHDGELDPPAARALVLDDGRERLVWVAVDLIAVDRGFVTAARRRLEAAGVRPGTLIVSASHTHSGPGAFLESWVMGIVATDRYEEAVRTSLLDAVAQAARRADAAKVPARAGALSVPGPPLTESRLGQPLDPDIVVLKLVSPGGAPIALLWNYAIHGTMLGARNLKYSGDVMGLASRDLERRLGVPALFVNGAVGDVSPRGHGHAAALTDAAALVDAVEGAWRRTRPAPTGALAIRTARLELPAPHVSLRNCTGRWVPRALTLSLARTLPRETELVAGSLGGAAWVTVPGELQTRLGRAVKAAAHAGGALGFVAGVSNDYLGYFLAAEDYPRVAYVACASFYGADAGALVTRAASHVLRALGGAR